MNIAIDVRLEPSVRISAIHELTQLIERAETVTPLVVNRL
jgi:hypothetical protein